MQQSHEEIEVLFRLMSDLHERRVVMLASDLKFSGSEGIFKGAQ